MGDVTMCNVAWTVTLCLASLVLMLASLSTFIVRYFCIRGSVIMINSSSLAMLDNAFIDTPVYGTLQMLRHVSSAERSAQGAVAILSPTQGFKSGHCFIEWAGYIAGVRRTQRACLSMVYGRPAVFQVQDVATVA